MTIHRIEKSVKCRRVAAYARVSTLAEKQEESFEAQAEYYTRLISQTKGWRMVKVFADQGISGTSAQKRPDFMRMIRCAQRGDIEKSPSSLIQTNETFEKTQKDAFLV